MVMQAQAVTYHPSTKKIYVGALQDQDFRPSYEKNYEPIAKINFEKYGKASIDEVIEPIGYELWRAAKRDYAAGSWDTSNITNIQSTELLTEILAREWRRFYAIEGVTRVPVPKLKLDIPFISTKIIASKKVPSMVAPTIGRSTASKVSFDLWKNGIDIISSDEAELQANISPLNLDIEQAAFALGKAANDQIAVVVEGFTTAAKGDWGAMNTNGDFSARNPLEDVQAEFTVISNLHNRVDTLAMHPKVASDYLSNTYVNGIINVVDRMMSGVFPLPKVPGVMAIVDAGFTDTKATLYDKRGVLLGEGPTVAEAYREARAGFNGYTIRQWLEPKKADNIYGRTMTSVSA